MTARNFDRDLMYTGAIGDNLGLGTTPALGTLSAPVVNTNGVVQRTGGYVNYRQENESLNALESLSLGIMFRTVEMNSVFRVRGFARSFSDLPGTAGHAPVAIIAGYNSAPGASMALTDYAMLATVEEQSTTFDLTLAFDGFAMAADDDDHTFVIAVMFWANSGTANLRPHMHLSVQDLRVAPPEYEAARR